jgi:lipopolysaccharide export system permease protein
LAGKDLDTIVILKFLIYKMPSVVPLVLPLSVLLASIMTFGDLAENYEFAAIKSSGISFNRAMRSSTLFILLLSVGAFFFANNVIPLAEYKFINFRKDIAQVKPAMAIAEGQFSDIGYYNIKVDKKTGENGNFLHGITIHKKINLYDGSKNVIKAKDGELVSSNDSNLLQMVLHDGYYYEDIIPKKYEDRSKLPFAKSSFKKYIINIDLSKLNGSAEGTAEITNTNTMLTVNELKYTIDSLQKIYYKDVKSFTENISQRNALNEKTAAAKARMKLYHYEPNLLAHQTIFEKKDIFTIANSSITNTNFSIEGSKYEMEAKTKDINSHWIALYDKFVIAFACLLMFFIGAPLGAIIRKGGLGLPIVFAVLIFIIFHFINTFGKKVAQENGISPFLGCWMSTMVLLPLALFLSYRATNDLGSFSFDGITIPLQTAFKKLFPGAKNV